MTTHARRGSVDGAFPAGGSRPKLPRPKADAQSLEEKLFVLARCRPVLKKEKGGERLKLAHTPPSVTVIDPRDLHVLSSTKPHGTRVGGLGWLGPNHLLSGGWDQH